MLEMCGKGEDMMEFLSLEVVELMYSAIDGMLVDFLMEWFLTNS